MHLKRRRNSTPSVDLTPMIDVVFQLILFFLVSTTFAVLPAINVNLPSSETSKAETVANITITVNSNEEIYFNETKANLSSLDNLLKKFDTEGKKREEYPVSVEADENCKNGLIVKIFDVLRKNGFVSVNLRTKD